MSHTGHSHEEPAADAPVSASPVSASEVEEIPTPELTGDVVVDQKALMATALARKNAHALKRSGHLDGQNNLLGSSTPGVSKRQFRRKSGG
ncbi:hypothetical protein EH165_10985 [Nakamurella antarctica]|uniref:Uncharacterized protein n=1 Tax=Nakamurella antarctica TaxID=1902245 RepID=A0A3G8ZX18_9ACTN|nr:DUF5302 domain-containing protein [Nakamurella antarctica]AZI58576.1 hypothetical protein EH165_10985 [Nakamurella antarctica]